MPTTLSFRTDPDIEARLEDFMAESGLTRSQAAREIFRQALLDLDPVTRGWKEGFRASYAKSQADIARGINGAG